LRLSTALQMPQIDCLNWLPIWSVAEWQSLAAPGGPPAALAAKAATTTIPIVFEAARNKRIERAAQVNLRCVLGRIFALMLRQTPVEKRFRTA